MKSIQVITHRGLDPSKEGYFMESSREAFIDQLDRGYGLEFDLQITSDGKVVVIHDSTLKRISLGKDERAIRDVAAEEIITMDFNGSHIATLDYVLDLIEAKQVPGAVSAMHLKKGSQNIKDLDIIISYLQNRDTSKFFIFDTTIETATYLKLKNSKLRIAPSVAASYDIERYNNAVGGTLLSVDEVLAYKELFSGVWLDEWDLTDRRDGAKVFYTQELISMLQSKGLWVGLVTPELHGTSPGLLGGEAHPDAKPFERLSARLKQIVNLKPDAICTDYPDYVYGLLSQ